MSSSSPEDTASDRKSSTVCFLCRQRKTKCDRGLPCCGFCIKAKVNCQYVAKQKKRGLRAGYVSELEARLEAVEGEIRALKQTPVQELPNPTPETFSFGATPPIPRPQTAHLDNNTGDIHSEDALTDLRSLPVPLFRHLVETWFKDCQPWCPIIHRTHMQASLESFSFPVNGVEDVVLRAVLALTISYSSQVISLGYAGRNRLSNYLRSEVLTEALSKVSLSSLQALLIICILDYGSDDVSSAWSLLSVCRRMCEQTGLFNRLLSQIEHQTPTTFGPPSRDAFEGEELAVPLTWVTLAMDSVWTVGAAWKDSSASLMEHLSSIANLSTPDFADSFRTFVHLGAIGLQPLHSLFWDQERRNKSRDETASLAICDEIYQNLLTYTHSQSLPTYTFLPDGSIDFDPNAVLTSTLSSGAICILYQSHINLSEFSLAHQRCLAAVEEMITTIRTVSDADLEFNSPNLGPNIFAVARFKLASYKASSRPRESTFDVLMHGLNMCGRRWTLARRLDIVLRAAIVEVDANAAGNEFVHKRLPDEFWDLKKSSVDINEGLKVWVSQYKPSLYVGSLNGPYAPRKHAGVTAG